jgi:hypothetical protein
MQAIRLLLITLLACATTATLPAKDGAPDQPSTDTTVGEAAPVSPPIISREKWNAKPALPGMKPHNIAGIILHHTAVKTNPAVTLARKMQGLQSFSQQPGQVTPTYRKPAWPDVPYHFYVGVDGRIAEGRDLRFAGDTNTNYDTSGYIQVVIEGDFEKEKPVLQQLDALRDLLVWLTLSWDIPTAKIGVHKGFAATTCPGRNFLAVLPTLLAKVEQERRKLVDDFCATAPAGSKSDYCGLNVTVPPKRAERALQ